MPTKEKDPRFENRNFKAIRGNEMFGIDNFATTVGKQHVNRSIQNKYHDASLSSLESLVEAEIGNACATAKKSQVFLSFEFLNIAPFLAQLKTCH